MNQTYWVLEFIKVLLAYAFVVYIWPSVVFRKHLSGKSRTYRFCFCVNMSILLINTGVLFLGLLHILNQIFVILLFWGVFLVQLIRNYDLGLSRLKDIRSVLKGTLSVRRMLLNWHTFNVSKLKPVIPRWWKSTKGRRLEYSLLIVILVFATVYFSENALQTHCYGASDQYVHHAWIYGLEQGEIFIKGIYPEGMHCFIYLMGKTFPIGYYSIVLFLAGAYIHGFILSAYILGKKLFGWRLSGLLAITGFLTIELTAGIMVTGLSRLSWTLPQEFAMYAVFMTSYALIGFLRQKTNYPKKRSRIFRLSTWKKLFRLSKWRSLLHLSTWKKLSRTSSLRSFFLDEYLFIFTTSIAVTICSHFYATIMTVFPCLVIAFVYVRRLFRRGVFKRVVAGALIGFMIAATPMFAAYAEGHPLQGSLYWAMNVTNKSLGKTSTAKTTDSDATTNTSATEATEETASDDMDEIEENLPITAKITNKIIGIVQKSYCELYKEQRGWFLFYTCIAVLAFSVALLMIHISIDFIRKRKKKKRLRYFINHPEGYLITALSVIILVIAYKPRLIGLPSLLTGDRLCAIIDMFSMLLYASCFDIVFCLLRPLLKDRFLIPLSILSCAGIYVFAQMSGMFHGFTYCMLTRYPIAVEFTKEITKNLPNNTYTIVSTTDELYQLIEDGYHEEWIDFIEKSSKKSYTIPTPYIFFYIEKRPILYAQYNCASGPEWLATEKYSTFYGGIGSQYPEILHRDISEESAAKTLSYSKKRSDTASNINNRVILESKAYEWYKKFSEMYPNDGEVIYEDDDFICYCVHQNEFSLFSLGIMENGQERRSR